MQINVSTNSDKENMTTLLSNLLDETDRCVEGVVAETECKVEAFEVVACLEPTNDFVKHATNMHLYSCF